MHPKTADYIERLKWRIAQQKEIIDKRNRMFHALKNKMYDLDMMFNIFIALREIDYRWFKEYEIPDYFILQHVKDMDTFRIEDAQKVVSELPTVFIRLKPSKRPIEEQFRVIVNASIKRMIESGLIGKYTLRRERVYFIKPAGKWFLMQRIKELRELMFAVIKEHAVPKRKLGLKRRL